VLRVDEHLEPEPVVIEVPRLGKILRQEHRVDRAVGEHGFPPRSTRHGSMN
jgi:hypothetical protein